MCDSSSFWTLPPHQAKDIAGYIFNAVQAGITAWLAWVGYKVAKQSKDATQAQRDIASNQYKISLYQVRREALDDLDSWIYQNQEYDFQKYEKYRKVISLIQCIDCVFDADTNLGKIKEKITQIRVLDPRIGLSQIPGMPARYIALGKGIEHVTGQNRASGIYSELLEELETIAVAFRKSLKVPSRPY